MLERLMVLVPQSNFPLRTGGLRHWVLTGALAWAGWTLTPGTQAAVPFTLTTPVPTAAQRHAPAPIAWNELGTKATAQYAGGDALAVTPTAAGGMTLRCEFQKLAGEVTPGGLWLASTITNAPANRFSVVAAAVGRQGGTVAPLPAQGTVTGDTNGARFVRPGLTEEYSVSVDGVRQDFVIASAPAGPGELRVELAVHGARAQTAANGVRLVLDGSGRTLAYGHLRVLDATGRPLTARLEVPAPGRLAVRVNDAAAVYPVRIDPTFSDANWVTLGSGMNGPVLAMAFVGSTLYVGGEFTTAGGISANNIARWNGTNWSALGSGVVLSGGGAEVFCLAVSGSTLYVGGAFDTAGGISASCVASWNGTNWSALGSGVPATYALAVYGTNLYAGGEYESSARIGGVVGSAGIAYWNGTKWTGIVGMSAQSTYGTVINVYTLAVYRGLLYVGGTFVVSSVGADGIVAWNGANYQSVTGWTPTVRATAEVRDLLAANDTLYAEGVFEFKNPDSSTHVQLASFDGTNWLGVGNIQDFGALAGATTTRLIDAMTISGGNLYVGGIFTSIITSTITIPANNIACWNGSSWSAVGSGVTGIANPSDPSPVYEMPVNVLAASGNSVYVGGYCTNAGTQAANSVVELTAGAVSAAQSTVSASPTSVTADGSTPSTITVTLTDTGGNPIAGKTVTLAKTSGAGSPVISAASGPSDVNGVVTFTVTSTNAATDVFTATDSSDSVTNTQTASVTFTAGSVSAAHSTVSAAPSSVAANGATAATITVTLKDAQGNPVSGKTVTLAQTSGSGSPTVSAASGSSDVNGVVTFTVTSTTPATDVFTATDSTDSLTLTATAGVTFTVSTPSAAQSTVSAAPGTVTADGFTNSTITVTLKDASGNPVSGKTVTLAKTSGAGSPTISAASGTSSGSGVVTFTVKSTTAATDVFTATDNTDSLPITQTASVTFTAGAVTAAQSTVSASLGSVTADGSTTSTITVTLADANGNPVSGKTVTLAKTSGAGSPTISAASGASSGSGVVTFTVKSTTPATDVFSATDSTDSLAITQTASVTFLVGSVSAAYSTVSASPTSVVADGATTATLTVTLLDANGNPVSGKTVTLSQTSGAGSPVISAASGPSSGSGVVTFTIYSSTPAPAGDGFTATDTTDSITITPTGTVTFTALPPLATPMTVVVPKGLMALISLSDLATNWSDFYGYPLSLTAINFTSADNLTVNSTNLTIAGGAYVISSNAFLEYVNSSTNVSDRITYTISDGQGNTTNGVINLFSSPSSLFGPVTGAGNAHSNSMTVNFVGLPGNTYNVERSQDLITWKSIWTTNVPPAGTFRFTDTFGDLGGIVPAYAYYRLAWWPANQ